jgi:type IV pilus assembly protein PilZ
MSHGSDERHGADEQRAQRRSPVELKVEYERMNTFFYDYTKNISRGGTFVQTETPLAVGTRFAFKLSMPALAQPLYLLGEVRWVRRDGDPGMGIQFIFEDEASRAAVDELVERLMVESLGPLITTRLRADHPRG